MAIELLDEETQAIVDKVEKMLRLAANNPNPEERARAEEKAQEWLAKFNLDMATIEQHGGTENGRRAEENLKGGYYEYQRDLWRAVAELNFCMYWNQIARIIERKFLPNPKMTGFRRHEIVKHENQHRLVGRVHNIILTRTMCEYIEQAIERVVAENCKGSGSQLRSVWANSFRRGCYQRVVERLYEKRRHMVAEAERAARDAEIKARKAGAKSHSSARGMTLVDLAQKEDDANNDFIMGEDGYSARQRAEDAAERQARAQHRADLEREWNDWALENPEEAARQAKQDRARQRKLQASRDYYWQTKGQYSYRRERDDGIKGDRGAYFEGREKGEKVSIDAQAGGRKTAGAIG